MSFSRIKYNLPILLYDIRNGCRKNIIIYFLAMLFTALSVYSFGRLTDNYVQRGIFGAEPGAMDYLVYLFGGMKVVDKSSEFEIPILWMTLQVLAGFCVCIYPVNDLDSGGTVILPQFGSRAGWWISKCLWSIIQAAVLYIIIFATAGLLGIINGSGLQYHPEIFKIHAGVLISDIKLLGIVVLAAPFLYSVMSVLVQVNLSLFIGPINSFIFMVAYHILSVYGSSFIFLGSVSMIYRNKSLTGEGVDWILLLVLCGFASIAAVIAGVLKFRCSDLLGKKSW